MLSEKPSRNKKEGISFNENVVIQDGFNSLHLCFQHLAMNVPDEIPSKDSKLTRILKEFLASSPIIKFFCCVYPLDKNFDECLNTMKLGDKCKCESEEGFDDIGSMSAANQEKLFKKLTHEKEELVHQIERLKKVIISQIQCKILL